MAEEVEEVCGPKGKHDPDRTAYRHGSDDGTVTLGGRRVEIERPRMRTKDGESEVPCRTYEQVEVKARSTPKSSVSRTFQDRTKRALLALMSRSLADIRLAAMMIVALGITTQGVKVPLGLWEGDTENATVVKALLSDLVGPRAGPGAGDALHPRRIEGPAQGGPLGVR